MAAAKSFEEDLVAKIGKDLCLFPGDVGYEESRNVWNALINRHPRAIIQVKSDEHVSALIQACVRYSIPVTVRGGGHNIAGLSVADNAVMIDLSRYLHQAHYHEDTHLITVQGGALWRDVDKACSAHGRFVPAGLVSHTGVGGLLLGGGVGWLSRRYGPSCSSLVACRIVTADGGIHDVREGANFQFSSHQQDGNQHKGQRDTLSGSEILRALRGGGGGFGVVTELTLQTHPAKTFHTTLMVFEYSKSEVLQLMDAYAECCGVSAGREMNEGGQGRVGEELNRPDVAMPDGASMYAFLSKNGIQLWLVQLLEREEVLSYDDQYYTFDEITEESRKKVSNSSEDTTKADEASSEMGRYKETEKRSGHTTLQYCEEYAAHILQKMAIKTKNTFQYARQTCYTISKLNSLFDLGNSAGHCMYWSRSTCLARLWSAGLAEALDNVLKRRDSVEFVHMGGQISRSVTEQTSLPLSWKTAQWEVHALARYHPPLRGLDDSSSPSDNEKEKADWVKSTQSLFRKFATFLSEDQSIAEQLSVRRGLEQVEGGEVGPEGEDDCGKMHNALVAGGNSNTDNPLEYTTAEDKLKRVKDLYGSDAWQRLSYVKRVVDPGNVFFSTNVPLM